MMSTRQSISRALLPVAAAAAVLALVSGGGPMVVAQSGDSFDVAERSIDELQAAMAQGRVTSARLVELYLDRIDAYDQAGPRLNSVLYLNPNAGRDARALDDDRRRRGPRGPLHGIPVLLKDNFDTRDMPTTGGSLALSGVVPRADAYQVKKLREAGAVLLGKVNLHELALGLTTVSSLGGQTLNPYDLRRAPGGSSGGSAAAAAASFAAFTMGTDTSGSIRIPSSHNSLVGLRPTAGLSSRAGIIPFGHTQDAGGPMTRSVTDAAIVLDATAGYDPGDPITAASKGRMAATYRSALRADALKGARIGVLRELFGSSPEDEPVAAVVRTAVDDMTRQGAAAVDVVVPGLGRLLMASSLLSQELKFDFREYLRRSPGARIKSLEDLLASGLHTAQFQAFVEGANGLADDYPSSADYQARLMARQTLAQAVLEVMEDNQLDVLAYPTVRRIAPLVGGNQAGSNAALSAQTGFPAIAVPAGFTVDGFPVGIEMLGRPFAEATVLGLAFAYERATGHRRPPPATPPLTKGAGGGLSAKPPVDTGPGSVRFDVTATGAQAQPPSGVAFGAVVRFTFNEQTRQLGYDVVSISGARRRVGGVYLHRRGTRPNGGVAHILAKASDLLGSGSVTLSDAEVSDLRAGKFYVSALDAGNPFLSARGNLLLP
jgi:Asp-tRNA(Asn)/Glu-tRNA(Gln) amidotransferase A subunit family amidase